TVFCAALAATWPAARGPPAVRRGPVQQSDRQAPGDQLQDRRVPPDPDHEENQHPRDRRPGPVRGSAGPDPALAPLAPPGLRRSRRAGLGISLVRFEALSGLSGDPLSIDFYQDVDAYSLGRRS